MRFLFGKLLLIQFLFRYFNMVLDEDVVRPQDIKYVFRYATKFPATNLQAWDFFKAHWDEIPEGYVWTPAIDTH